MAGAAYSPISAGERRALFAERESIDLEDNIILKIHIVPASPFDFEEAALRVLLIMTTRTMGILPYENVAQRLSHAGRILQLESRTGLVELAIPLSIIEPHEGLAHLVSVIASPADYSYCSEYWIDNVEFPRRYSKAFLGPRFGIDGIRSLFPSAVGGRPLVGLILKPRRGVSIVDLKKVALEALLGGCDFVCDDLLMVDPLGELALAQRAPEFATVARVASQQTGEKKRYFMNVSSSPLRALDLAEPQLANGNADALVVNAFTMGFGGLHDFVEKIGGRVPVVTTNFGAGILSRPRLMDVPGKPTGCSETVISKLSRLAGADGVHAGTTASECYGEAAWGPATRALRAGFYDLKPSFAVAEGDLNAANLWENIKTLGRDVMLEPTSGIVGIPGGAKLAAKAFRTLAERLDPDMTDDQAHRTIMDTAKRVRGLADILKFHGYQPTKPIFK